jgi:hypothetical protein
MCFSSELPECTELSTREQLLRANFLPTVRREAEVQWEWDEENNEVRGETGGGGGKMAEDNKEGQEKKKKVMKKDIQGD